MFMWRPACIVCYVVQHICVECIKNLNESKLKSRHHLMQKHYNIKHENASKIRRRFVTSKTLASSNLKLSSKTVNILGMGNNI